MDKIEVGQVLYREKLVKDVCEIQEVVVKRIGKKYFYLDSNLHDSKCGIDRVTLKYTDKNYLQRNFQLYRNVQDILDRRVRIMLANKLKNYFSRPVYYNKNTLEQLQKIADILELWKTKQGSID